MKWKYTTWDTNLYIQNVTHDISLGERCVAIHFPHQPSIPNEQNITMYDILQPDWFTAQIPKQATPVDIQGQNIVTIHGATSQWPLIQEPPTNFQQWREQLPSAEKRLLTFVTYLTADSETQIRQHLVTSTATLYIGTDGGRKEGDGSFSWLICSTNREKLVCNAGTVDGWYKCQSSYRSELTALSSAMLFLDELSTFYELTVTCNFHCLVDSTGAISTIEHTRDHIPTRHYPDHADIVSTLKDATQIISRSMCQHVKSHQDDKKAYSELPFNAQVNVLCDRMATRHMNVHREGEWASQQNFYPTRNQPVVVSYMSRRIPSHYIKRLREAISSKAHRQYLQQRYKWEDQVWSTIAWESLYTIGRRSTKKPCFVNRTKLVHNWLNLGSQRAKFHAQSTVTAKQCPYCQQDETFIHLLTCNDPRAKKCRFEASTNLRKGLKSIPGGSTLLRLINTWIQNPTFHPQAQAATLGLQRSVDQAVASQSRIGWVHLFRGIISSDWGFIIPDDDTSMTPHMRRSNAKLHLSSFIQTLQNYALDIWAGRNTMLHSNSVVPISIREAQVNSEISALYDIHHTFTTRVQFYFRQPLDILIRAPYRTRQRWLIITKLATSQQQRPLNGQSQLTSYHFSLHPEFQFTSTPRTPSVTYITPPSNRDDNIQTRLTKFFLPQ